MCVCVGGVFPKYRVSWVREHSAQSQGGACFMDTEPVASVTAFNPHNNTVRLIPTSQVKKSSHRRLSKSPIN